MYEAAATYAVLRQRSLSGFQAIFERPPSAAAGTTHSWHPAIPRFVPPWPTTAKRRP